MASAAILSLDELRDSRRCAAMQQRVQEHMAATGPGKGAH